MESWPSTSSRSVMSRSRTNVLQMGVNNTEPYNTAMHGKVEGKPSDDHDETLTEARLLPILIKIECDTRWNVYTLFGWIIGDL